MLGANVRFTRGYRTRTRTGDAPSGASASTGTISARAFESAAAALVATDRAGRLKQSSRRRTRSWLGALAALARGALRRR
jgi:hypothetical protein